MPDDYTYEAPQFPHDCDASGCGSYEEGSGGDDEGSGGDGADGSGSSSSNEGSDEGSSGTSSSLGLAVVVVVGLGFFFGV